MLFVIIPVGVIAVIIIQQKNLFAVPLRSKVTENKTYLQRPSGLAQPIPKNMMFSEWVCLGKILYLCIYEVVNNNCYEYNAKIAYRHTGF